MKVKVFIDDRTMTRYECALSAAGVLGVTEETCAESCDRSALEVVTA